VVRSCFGSVKAFLIIPQTSMESPWLLEAVKAVLD